MIRYFTSFLCALAAIAQFSSGPVLAETDPGGGADVPADSSEQPVTEDVTVSVTRTKEGIEVVTPDGRHVLLRNDNTWEYLQVEQGKPTQSAMIVVAYIKEVRNAFKVGLRLSKLLGY